MRLLRGVPIEDLREAVDKPVPASERGFVALYNDQWRMERLSRGTREQPESRDYAGTEKAT